MDKDMGDPGGVTTVSSSASRGRPDKAASRARRRANKRRNALLWEVWHRTHWHPNHVTDAHEYEWHEDWPEALEPMRALFATIVEATQEVLANGPQGQDAADPQPRDEQQPLQETDHDR